MALPIVVVAGRPNVGKSTLFNKLAGRRAALVADTPGVTRDRKEARAMLRGREVLLVDTAGLEESAPETLAGRMRASSEAALADAALVLFVIDARAGIVPADAHFAEWLRRAGRPVLVVANKAEGRAGGTAALEAYALGLGDPVAVSAEHGEGLAALMSEIADRLPPEMADGSEDDDPARPLKLAIIGRPNAGKSTLLNRLLGHERMITGPEPGLTRDAVAVRIRDAEGEIEVVDTAGMRKRARVDLPLEKMSVSASIEALKMAELVVLTVDATEGLHEQDLQIARLVEREGRACIIALNKWDMVTDRQAARRAVDDRLQTSLAQMKGIAVVPLSALSGQGVEKLLPDGASGRGGVEPASVHRRAESLVRGGAGAPPAAARGWAPAQAALHDAGQGATADLRDVRHAGGADARGLPPLSGEWPARVVRHAWHADPASVPWHHQSVRGIRAALTRPQRLYDDCFEDPEVHLMSSIQPIAFSSDQASLARLADPVTRSGRSQSVPEVLPAAVILPRSAAWLNTVTITPSESVASTEIAPDQSSGAQSDKGSAGSSSTLESLNGASFASAQGGSALNAYAQTSAIQAALGTGSAAQDSPAPGPGSVLQLV